MVSLVMLRCEDDVVVKEVCVFFFFFKQKTAYEITV